MVTSSNSSYQRAARAARDLRVFHTREFVARGFARTYLQRLRDRGEVRPLARGVYAHKSFRGDENQSLVETAKRIPQGVVCLLSALRFHQIGTQAPEEVWIAIPRGHAYPRASGTELRLCKFSTAAHASGIEKHEREGGTVRVYSPAKTVADCFKFRHRIGLDVCIEALTDCLAKRRASISDLMKYGAVCRVQRVMRPYLEALA